MRRRTAASAGRSPRLPAARSHLSPGFSFSMQLGLVWVVAIALLVFHPDYAGSQRLPHGRVERLSPLMDEVIPPGAQVEVVASGFHWVEGPVWVPGAEGSEGFVLFSDVIGNTMHRFDPSTNRTTVHMHPSGAVGLDVLEPGSNGIGYAGKGQLVVCDHGNRRLYRVAAAGNGARVPLATHFEGNRLNSPNDLVIRAGGDIYFTDPSYGLVPKNLVPPDGERAASRELSFNGVYRIRAGSPPGAEPELLISSMQRPNGLGLSPDGRKLYVSNSNQSNPHWMVFQLNEAGAVVPNSARQLADATTLYQPGMVGNPDGLKVDSDGRIFATGPGGVHVFNADGARLGLIHTGVKTGNVALAQDGYLYIACDSQLARVKTHSKPLIH